MSVISKFSLKISTRTKWRFALYSVVGFLLCGVLLSIIFIYEYIYTTLDNANTVVLLNANSSFNLVDSANYKKSEQLLDLKRQFANIPANIRNIFTYVTTTKEVATSTKPK